MRVFVYEHVTAGGMGESPPASLLSEGLAMVSAVAEDFVATGHRVLLMETSTSSPLLDWQLGDCSTNRVGEGDWRTAFQRGLEWADAALVIAPEIDGDLLRCVSIAERSSAQLLGPGRQLVRLCADKASLAERLRSACVRTVIGTQIEPGRQLPAEFSWPAVLKPCDGAGSQDVHLLSSHRDDPRTAGERRCFHLEKYEVGVPASVAVLCGPSGLSPLPSCSQCVSPPRFEYRGGFCPLDLELDERARRLASAAVSSLPEPRGYLGVDMILGEHDVVLEVNPRLTTSYVGLRKATKQNLMETMLEVLAGGACELPRAMQRVEFNESGTVIRGSLQR